MIHIKWREGKEKKMFVDEYHFKDIGKSDFNKIKIYQLITLNWFYK